VVQAMSDLPRNFSVRETVAVLTAFN
jgi:hypothetical protein